MFKRKKRAAYRVCDYPDCLETATRDVDGRHACQWHVRAVAQLFTDHPAHGPIERRDTVPCTCRPGVEGADRNCYYHFSNSGGAA